MKNEKEYIKLVSRLDEIRNIQRNLGYYTLDEPIFKGYVAYLDLRDDIKNRQDSEIFHFIVEKYGFTTYYKKEIKDFSWNKPLSWQHRHRNSQDIAPHIRHINEQEYINLQPQYQKYFTYDVYISLLTPWTGKKYYCNIPQHFFVLKYKKYYITKIKISDVLLEQEEAEIKSILHSKFFDYWCGYKWKRPFDRRCAHRRFRVNNKKKIRTTLDFDDCSFETKEFI